MKTSRTQDFKPEDRLSFRETAAALEVSLETLRNWQRLGVVEREVWAEQIERIKCRLTSQGRLMSRANKLQNATDAHRNREGIYYTPQWIVSDMLSSIPKSEIAGMTFLDPCCGSGNFLEQALLHGFSPHNIYGFDTDGEAVKVARKRVKGAHIECGDFLECATSLGIKFDYIYTNPPWGKRLNAESRALYSQLYSTPRSADTSALFMVAALGVLREGGKLGFLVQEALFNIGSFEWLREQMLQLKVEWLKDYGKPFKGLMTRAQGVVITNLERQSTDECRCTYEEQEFYRTIDSFATLPKRIINFWATPQDMMFVEKLYSASHKTLRGHAKWALGVVTGDNRRHCSTAQNEEFGVGVITGGDIYRGNLLPPTLYINGDLTRYQQSAPKEMYEAAEKLVYRFISSDLVFCVDRQQRYLLNSANCVVVSSELGATAEQVSQLLNSRVINWLFRVLFRSHKILRSDIEELPLHIGYFERYDTFDEDAYCEYIELFSRGILNQVQDDMRVVKFERNIARDM